MLHLVERSSDQGQLSLDQFCQVRILTTTQTAICPRTLARFLVGRSPHPPLMPAQACPRAGGGGHPAHRAGWVPAPASAGTCFRGDERTD